ncbi:MAG TPA: transcriptional regulator [Firmicutes bacterium]|nr:transcriptional regulator [Bacillota bacterium]
MKISSIIELTNATCFYSLSQEELNLNISNAFTCDLMSDVLAYVNEDIILITGLVHIQTLRTAEMLDIKCVLCVRGKQPDEAMIELAKINKIILLGTTLTSYEASGILFQAGLNSLNVV